LELLSRKRKKKRKKKIYLWETTAPFSVWALTRRGQKQTRIKEKQEESSSDLHKKEKSLIGEERETRLHQRTTSSRDGKGVKNKNISSLLLNTR